MTAILAFCYGGIFAACAIVAGVMYRAADSALGAAQAMRAGARLSPETTADEATRRVSRKFGFVPAMVMHGSRDTVVHPRNAEQIVGQFRKICRAGEHAPRAAGGARGTVHHPRRAQLSAARLCAQRPGVAALDIGRRAGTCVERRRRAPPVQRCGAA